MTIPPTPADTAVTSAIADQRKPQMRRPRRHKEGALPYLLILPVLILLTIFVIVPTFFAIYLSFFNWSFYESSEFVALKNFTDVLTDPKFRDTIVRGLQFVLMTVPIGLLLSFMFASFCVAVGRKFSSVLKVSIYLPTIISGVITSIVFGVIYEYSGGLLNALMIKLGLAPQAWLGDPNLALQAIAAPAIWLGLGLTSLIMVAAMLDIPTELYESASLEGANWFQKTLFITIPQMKNVILYLLITGFVGAIQQFELPLVMTGGGPMESTTLPNLFIFNHFRGDTYTGYSIAAALLLFVVLGSISALIFRVLNSEKLVD